MNGAAAASSFDGPILTVNKEESIPNLAQNQDGGNQGGIWGSGVLNTVTVQYFSGRTK